MYLKNLHKLIKEKADLKFRIKDEEQSKAFQEMLFAMDVPWRGGNIERCYLDRKFLYYLDRKFLYLDNENAFGVPGDYNLMGSTFDSEEYFNEHENKEYDLENDCLVEESRWPNLKKLVEEKTDLKFRIKSPEQSKEFQEMLFRIGIKWHKGQDCPIRLEEKFLYLDDEDANNCPCDYDLMGDKQSNKNLFEQHKDQEYDLENDCLVEIIDTGHGICPHCHNKLYATLKLTKEDI